MPTTALPEISEKIIRDCITKGVTEVFKTMLTETATYMGGAAQSGAVVPEIPGANTITGAHIVSTVGFVGEVSGLVHLNLTSAFAMDLASKMLGMSPAEIKEMGEEVAADAIGELTNMTVGVFKNALCDMGYACKLTIPTIVRGTDFKIEQTKQGTRHLYTFSCKGHCLLADIIIKKD